MNILPLLLIGSIPLLIHVVINNLEIETGSLVFDVENLSCSLRSKVGSTCLSRTGIIYSFLNAKLSKWPCKSGYSS